MKILLLLLCTHGGMAMAADKTAFGAPVTLQKAESVASVLARARATGHTELLVTGMIKKVCEKKGCWMVLAGDDKEIRVTFKDYGFFVPVSLQNRSVLVQGKLETKMLSIDDQAHYLKDAGETVDRSKLLPKLTTSMVASGVKGL